MARPAPSRDSSLLSLSRSLRLADTLSRLPRPSVDSHGTGATGSSEVPGSATRSLLRSVARRSDLGAMSDADLDSPFHNSPTKASDESWSEVGGSGGGPLRGRAGAEFVVPGVGASGRLAGEDWSEASVDEAASKASKRFPTIITASQEEEGLYHSVTRSQTDFSKWLEDTMYAAARAVVHKHARGDGTSTVATESVYSALASATRETRIGLGGSATNPGLGSAFSAADVQTRNRSTSWDFRSESSFRCAGGLQHSSELLRELTIGVENDFTATTFDAGEDVKPKVEEGEKEAKPDLQLQESVKQDTREDADQVAEDKRRAMAESGRVAVRSSGRRWKAATFALAAYIAAPHVQPYLQPFLQPYLPLVMSLIHPTATPTDNLAVVEFVAVVNETLAPIPFATPITIGTSLPLTAYAAAVGLLVAATATSALLTSRRPAPLTKTSQSPLLELNASAVLLARELLPRAQLAYNQCNLHAAETDLAAVLSLACAPIDKAIACELLGRTRYRLARQDRSDRAKLVLAAETLARAVRMNPASGSARASWGRALYKLGELEAAVRPLKSAIARDDASAVGHEYLGKVLMALGERDKAEVHLRRAAGLDPVGGYRALAFLGEQLHLAPAGSGCRSDPVEARALLEEAIRLRNDYPAAHARLAFLATERLDSAAAAHHLRLAIATRENGLVDDDLPASSAATWGPAPFLNLFFVTPSTLPVKSPAAHSRPAILRRAMVDYGTTTPLLAILLALSLLASADEADRAAGIEDIATLEEQLGRRAAEFGEDLEARGLWALCLLGVGQLDAADGVYDGFWKGVAAGGVEVQRGLSFLVMALYEQRGRIGGKA